MTVAAVKFEWFVLQNYLRLTWYETGLISSFALLRPAIPEDVIEIQRCLGVRACPHSGCTMECWEWEMEEHLKWVSHRIVSVNYKNLKWLSVYGEINKIWIESQLTVHGNGFKLKILRMRKFCRSCPNRQPSPPKQTPKKRRSLMPRTDDTPKMSRVTRSSTFNLGNSRPEDFQMGRRRMNLRRSTQQQTLNNHWRL